MGQLLVQQGSGILNPLPITRGGTGATSASVARTNLGLGTGDSPSFTGLSIDSPTFVVDSVNHRIGIGTASPGQILHVKVDQDATTNAYVENASTGTSAITQLLLQNTGNYFIGFRQYGVNKSSTLSGINLAGLSAIVTGSSVTALLINASQNTTPIYHAIGGVVMTTLNATGLGIGAAVTPTRLVDVQKSWTTLADNDATAIFSSTVTLPGNSSGDLIGLEGLVTLDQNGFNATDGTNAARGLQGAVTVSGSSGTVTNVTGFQAQVSNSGAGTITNGSCVYANLRNTGGGTFTNAHGLYVLAPSGGTNVTNFYGVRVLPATTGTNIYAITSTIAAASTRWNIYADGTAQNYFAGKVGLGVTTPTNDLSFGGDAARIIWSERNTTTAGSNLTVQSGGALSGGTDLAGGNLILSSGTSTGTGQSNIQFKIASASTTGTSDNAPAALVTFSSTNEAGTTSLVTVAETLPTTRSGASVPISITLTTAGSSTQSITGINYALAAGYTGSSNTQSFNVANNVAGTGTTYSQSPFRPNANIAISSNCSATTTGINTGVRALADNGDTNYGLWASSTIDKNSATNVGVVGIGLNGGTSPVYVGGYFACMSQAGVPTFSNAALIANNGSTTAAIFLGQDAATTVFSIIDGGNVGIQTSSPTNALSFGGNAARIIWLERHTTSDTAGNNLNLIAGGATSGATNRAGGDLVLSAGLGTGSGTTQKVRFRTYNATAASTSDNTAVDIAAVSIYGLELFNTQNAYITAITNPVIYGTASGGGAYPFLTAGNLILQSRTSGAIRDILFVAGTTPAAIMVVDGTNQRVGIMTTAPGFPLDVVGAIQTSASLKIKGSSSGTLTLTVAAAAGTTTLTLPGGTTDFSATGGTAQVVKQTSAGGAFTVATVAASEIASGAALTRVSDTNVTLTLGGTPTTALLAATSLTLGWSGQLGLSRGGTNADLSATGGTAQVLRQSSTGAAVTVGTLAASEIASPAALTKVDDTNVTLTLGGAPTTALLAATSLTLGWTGQLSVARGGTGATAFTLGSVVFAGSSGVYTQDNANFFWDDTNNRLGITTASPTNDLSFGGNTNRVIWMERHTTADTAGSQLTLQGGGATSGATNKAGGTGALIAGISTGSGISNVKLYVYGITAASTSDNAQVRTQISQAWSEGGTDRAATLFDGMVQFNNLLASYPTDVTLGATARIYGTASTGGSYPFQGAGHLVLQGRPDAGRDIVFATGTTPTTRMFITSAGNVGIGITTGTASQMLHITAGNILLSATSPAFTSGVSLQLGGSRTSPVAGNLVFGDGTGWKLHIGKGTDDAATQWVTFQDNGRVGIGVTATTPTATLDVISTISASIRAGLFTSTFTDPASAVTVLKGDANITLGANNALQMAGTQGFARVVGAGFDLTNTTAGLISGWFQSTVTSGAGTVTGSIGAYATNVNASVGILTNAYGIYTVNSNTSSGTLTNSYGVYVGTVVNSGGGTLGTNTGIHIVAQTVGSTAIYGIRSVIAAASTRWNLFIDGTAQNHFRGNVGIGTGTTTPEEALVINAGKLVLNDTGYATSKFNSQGIDWATVGTEPHIIINSDATSRAEISWIRGSRTYPEFTIRQHTTADTGGQIWVGGGTAAPSATVSFNSRGIGIFVASGNQRLDIQSGGARFSPLASAGAATAALAGLGAGNLTNGTYIYTVTHVNAHGESARGTSSNTLTVVDATTDGQVSLTGIAISSDSTTTARNIYRTAVGQVGLWLLTTINDNTTTTYTDNISDATLKTGAIGITHQGTGSGAIYTNVVATEKKALTFDGSGLRTTFNPARSTAVTTDQTLVSVTPATRAHGVFVYCNGYLYSIGGSAGTTVYYAAVGSLGRTDAAGWSTDAVFPVARSNTTGVAVGGYIYVIGGTTASSTTSFTTGTSTVYFGRPSSDGTVPSWQTTTALPAAVSAARCVAYNGYLYVVGGANTSSQAQTSVYYAKLNPDGTVGSWSTSANTLPVALIYHGLAVLNGYLYVFGGRTNDAGTGLATDNDDNQSATYYSLVNTSTGDVGAWSTSAQALPVANAFPGGYSWDGYIVAAGGVNTAGASTSVNYYARPQDFGVSVTAGEIQAWTASANNTGNSGLIAAAIAGNYVFYLVGGVNVRLMTPAVVRIAGDLDLLAETYRSHNFAGGASTGSGGGSLQCLNINALGNIATLGTFQVQGSSYFADAIGIRGSATNLLMVDGQAAHAIAMSRNFTSNTAGNNFTIQSGGATSAATNKSAGSLILSSGISTGSGTGSVLIQVSPGIAASTTDNSLVTALTVGGNQSTLFTGKSHQFNSNTDGDFQATGSATTSAGGTPIRHCSVVLNGYLYRMGGDDGATCTTTIQYAQLATDGTIAAWTTEATNSLPLARSSGAACSANGYIYVLGGKSTTSVTTASTTVYYNKPNPDGSLGTWGTTTALPSTLINHKVVYYNGYMYVTGGYNASSTVQSAVYYAKVNADGTVGSWITATNALGTAIAAHGMAVANGVLYVYGGTTTLVSSGGVTTVTYSIIGSDGSPGTWTVSSNSLNVATIIMGCVIANGYLYSIGGVGTAGSSIATVQYTALASSGDVGVWTTSVFTPGGSGSYESFALNGYLLNLVNNNVNVRLAQLNRLQAATTVDLLGLAGLNLSRGGEGSALYAGDIYSNSNLVVLGYSQHEGPAQFSSTIGLTGRTSPAVSSGNGIAGGTTFSIAAAIGGIASSVSNVTAGLGGILALTGGTGGAATGASGTNIGGAGGTIELIGGTGGAATSGTAGVGGNVNISGGNSTGTVGNVILAYTIAGGIRGLVGIGMTSPAYMLDVGTSSNGAIRANQHFITGNNIAAFNSTETQSLVYGTSNGGGAYPFLTSGNLVLQSRPAGANRDILFVTSTTQQITMMIDGTNQRIGMFGVTAPTNSVSFSGQAARTLWMERHTTADTAGNILTVQAGGATSAATNKTGGNLILAPGLGTGTGEANVKVQAPNHVAAGTGDTTLIDRHVYGHKAILTNDNSTLTTLVTCTLATDSVVAGIVRYTVEVVDGSHNVQLEAGEFTYTVTNTNGTRGNNTITFPTGFPKNVTTSGTLTLTFAISTAASPLVTVKCNSSLTASTGYPRISYSIENLTNQVIA